MRLYYQLMLNAMQSGTAYRLNTFITTLHRILSMFVQISLWTALYRSAKWQGTTGSGPVSLPEMFTYVVLGSALSILMQNTIINNIGEKVQTGGIATYLIRPVGLFRTLLMEHLGTKAFAVIFEALPVLLVGFLAVGISVPGGLSLLVFLMALVNAYLVFFLITYTLGLVSFWYLRVFHLELMLHNVILQFFSGLWIPIWFFPDALKRASEWLPFDLIYFQPLSVLLGKVDHAGMLAVLIKGWIWVGLLALLAAIVWNRGIRKLVVQGG